MHYGQIMLADSANGIGMRVSLFVSGCTNHCPGCFQPETWDFSFGEPYTKEVEERLIEELKKPYYDGLTILGGEPFEFENQPAVLGLVKKVSELTPKRSIWMYTGFIYDRDLIPGGKRYTPFTDSILNRIDVLVDGPFIEEKKDITLHFRGSSNQRILDMKKTRAEKQIVLSPLNDFGDRNVQKSSRLD